MLVKSSSPVATRQGRHNVKMMECEENTVKTSPFNEGIDNKGKNTLRIKTSAVAHGGAIVGLRPR